MKTPFLCLTAFMLFTSAAFSQIRLDSTFAGIGYVTKYISDTAAFARGMCIQADGKIVAVGSGETTNLSMVRYNTDGTLDGTFGNGGTVEISTPAVGLCSDVAQQTDGKLVVIGRLNKIGVRPMYAARFLTNGDRDSTFGLNGVVAIDTPIMYNQTTAVAVTILSNGKILVAGSENSPTRSFIMRLNTNGTLDNTFGTGGVTHWQPCSTAGGPNKSIVVQPDGKILYTVSHCSPNALPDFGLCRFTANGQFDSTFGINGIAVAQLLTNTSGAYCTSLQPDGKIIASGITYDTAFKAWRPAVVRFNTNGTLDSTFGVGGEKLLYWGYRNANCYAHSLKTDGKILLAGDGVFLQDSLRHCVLARLNSNGTFDSTFGNNGLIYTITANGHSGAFDMGQQTDGKIVLAGYSVFTGAYNNRFAVWRFTEALNVGVVDENTADNTLLIYPNPVQNEAVLSYTLTGQANISITVTDVNGREVKVHTNGVRKEKGEHKEKLDITELAAGTYIVTISNGKSVQNVQVVKQ